MNPNEAGSILSKMMNIKVEEDFEKDVRDGFSYGSKVVIHYIPPYANRFSLGDNLIRTTGYLENFNYSQVFIKNEAGCLEIINVLLVVNMKQIKEWLKFLQEDGDWIMKIDIEETKRVAELYGIEIAPVEKNDKTVHFKNGSSITPIDSENVRSKEKEIFISGINKICDCDDMILFLEEFCGIKLYWYQKVHLKLIWKLNKLGVIK